MSNGKRRRISIHSNQTQLQRTLYKKQLKPKCEQKKKRCHLSKKSYNSRLSRDSNSKKKKTARTNRRSTSTGGRAGLEATPVRATLRTAKILSRRTLLPPPIPSTMMPPSIKCDLLSMCAHNAKMRLQIWAKRLMWLLREMGRAGWSLKGSTFIRMTAELSNA